MKLSCPECGSHITSEHINIAQLVAKCAACDAVFSFADTVKAKAAATTLTDYEFEAPAGLSMDEKGGELTISRRWFSWKALPLLGFAAVWDVFLFGWYAMLGNMPGPVEISFKLFPMIHVAVGVGITYTALAKVFNRTKIRVDTKRITVRHGPFKWVGNMEVHTAAIEQLYVHEVEPALRSTRSKIANYEVHALLKGGGSVRVIKGLNSPFQALFIEQEIERHLGIQPLRVPGEYNPAPHEILVGRKRREAGSLSIAAAEDGLLSLSTTSERETRSRTMEPDDESCSR